MTTLDDKRAPVRHIIRDSAVVT